MKVGWAVKLNRPATLPSLTPSAMPFKFDSQHFFLTYPQSDIEHEVIAAAIRSIASVDWLRVCTEKHADGNKHLHAVGRFAKRFQSRNERVFDVEGRHPKIEPVRSIAKALAYVSKDGDYTDFGTVPVAKQKRQWEEIVEASKSDDKVEWLRVVHEERMSMHVAKELRAMHAKSRSDLDDYDERPICSALETLPKEWQSMLIVGAPGIGKTGFAMKYTQRPALLCKHIDKLTEFRRDYHKSIVFDDAKFAHLPRETQLQLCDFENQTQVHVRYGVAEIPARVPRLFLCNPECEPFIEDPAIQGRRVQVVRIHNSL